VFAGVPEAVGLVVADELGVDVDVDAAGVAAADAEGCVEFVVTGVPLGLTFGLLLQPAIKAIVAAMTNDVNRV
jgi:hypothetical protein